MSPKPNKPKPNKPKTNDTLLRVFRGGSWIFTSATYLRAAYRDDYSPTIRNINLGFRCALRGREPR